MTGKTGYLIERYYNGTLHYWNGRPLGSSWLNKDDAHDLDTAAWTPKPEDAVWFADSESASGVLAWSLGTVGRVAQQAMLGGST